MNYAAALIMIAVALMLNGGCQRTLVDSSDVTNRSGRAVQDWDGFVDSANALEKNSEHHKQIIQEADLVSKKNSNGTRAPFRWIVTSPRPPPQANTNNIYNIPVSYSHLDKNDEEENGENEEVQITLTVTGVGKRLLLSGCQPLQLVSASAIDYVRDTIAEHLGSTELASKVEHAQRLADGILFEMDTTATTVEVLGQANVRLQGACFHIEPSNQDFVTVAQHIRFGQ